MTEGEQGEGYWTHFIHEAFCTFSFMSESAGPTDFYDLEGNLVKKNVWHPPREERISDEEAFCEETGAPEIGKCINVKTMEFCLFLAITPVEREEYEAMLKAWEEKFG